MIATIEFQNLLNRCGLGEKDARVYIALLTSGPAPIRKVAGVANINRGTTHTILRTLIDRGLVSYYHKQKRQHYVAENPEKILTFFANSISDMQRTYQDLQARLPAFQALRGDASAKPAIRSYEGRQGVRLILDDVLSEMEQHDEKLYRVYSSVSIRDGLYRSFPSFTKERIKRGIFVRVVAIGAGGEYQECSERRWLPTSGGTPTYRIIYAGKVVTISQSANAEDLHAFVVRDEEIYKTEVIIFDQLWTALGTSTH